MKIRGKLLIAPGAAITFLLIFGVLSLIALSQVRGSLDDIYHQRFQYFKISANSLQDISTAHANVYRLFTWLGNYDEPKINKAAESIYKLIDSSAGELKALNMRADLSPEEHKHLEAILGHVAKYRKSVAQAIDLATVDPNMGMSAMQTADGAFQTLGAATSELIKLQDRLAQERHESATASYGRTLAFAVVILVAAIGAALVISLLMARAIVAPLHGAIASARDIAQGNLTNTIRPHGQDETGELLRAIADMQTSLRDVIGSMGEQSVQLSDVASALSAGSRGMASATTQQSEGAASMAAAVEEMTATMTQISKNASDADVLVKKSGNLSAQGQQAIQRMAEAMQRISQAVDESSSIITALGQQSNQITAIVNVITEIAEQTNLLALNAAIEAARAGDQGRGFAVVADEVRVLAKRTADSTQEIASMVRSIQDNTRRAVTSMAAGVALVGEGMGTARSAEHTIREIEKGTEHAVRSVEEISTALHQQSIASQEIARHVENIARMAEETSTSSRESAASADHMNSLADAARHTVSRFRL
jgi:methyl-accepting chemotaxis protein